MVPKVARAVVVGVIRVLMQIALRQEWPSPVVIGIVAVIGFSLPITAAILPEDRADALFHQYDGGGVTIQGPSLKARKQIGKSFSLAGSYYIDSITSASIDVITQGSPYEEERKEYGVSLDYLHDKTTISLAYGDSEESDFIAKSYHFTVSHSMFGDLTTVSLGYSLGADEVYENAYANGAIFDSIYVGDVERYSYRFNLSQVLTKKLIVNLAYDIITDESQNLQCDTPDEPVCSSLKNPYRFVWINGGYNQKEKYPFTHTTNAVALSGRYYMPYRAAMYGDFRFFSDSWDVVSGTAKLGYSQPFKLKGDWLLDFHYRFYTQSAASFYSADFGTEELRYMASDKELSTFTNNSFAVGVSYAFPKGWWKIDKSSLNFSYTRIYFDYQDFTDKRFDSPTYLQPYSFTADVVQLYFSIWY